MIKSKDNILYINDIIISFPIRIKQILIIQEYILVTLGFDAVLDCGYKDAWTSEVDSKWSLLHENFKNSSLYCYDYTGICIWEFQLKGFFNISNIDKDTILNDQRVKHWILCNPDKSNVFIVHGDDKFIVDYKTGDIYKKLEMR